MTSIDPELARFDDGYQSLKDLIEFPDIDDDVFADVYCIAHVLASGQIYANTCLPSEDDYQPFRSAVEIAVKSAKATPAIVDGKAHAVFLSYRVAFFKKNGAAEVGVYGNWGNDVDRFGLDYEAPQRYTNLYYPSVCDSYTPLVGITSTMVIDKDGTLSSEVVVDPIRPGLHKQCHSSIRSIHERSKYIPGRLGGEFVEATLVEVWGAFYRRQLN